MDLAKIKNEIFVKNTHVTNKTNPSTHLILLSKESIVYLRVVPPVSYTHLRAHETLRYLV